MRKSSIRKLPINISIRQLLRTEIITSEHACIFKHCSIKTTLVSHVLIEALVEIDEICMAGGGWGEGGSLLSSRKATSANRKKGQTISVT